MKKSLIALAAGASLAAVVFGGGQAFAAAPSKSIVLFDDANFGEDGASQGLAGSGCQNVFRDDVASSLWTNGGPVKIWTGANCTGKSAFVDGQVLDLKTIGFDNDISSVAF